MNGSARTTALAILSAALVSGVLRPGAIAADALNSQSPEAAALAREQGAQLAADLAQRRPTRDLALSGKLIRRTEKPKSRTEVGFRMWTKLAENSWDAGYWAGGSPAQPPVELTIRRVEDKPNEYFLTLPAASGPGAPPQPAGSLLRKLSASEVGEPFAGTDFFIMDLGLEFLTWPGQRLVATEMRKGRTCRILESLPAPGFPGGYSRVVSWVDIEGGGLILAEAYDESGNLFKEFAVRGVGKIEGQYEVKDMEIRNLREKSRTRFELELTRP